MIDIKKQQAKNAENVENTDVVRQFKPIHFSEYIRKRHVQFLDSVDFIDGIAITPSNDTISFIHVLINGSFYTVGMVDYFEKCNVRLTGELVGFDGYLSDVNVFIHNFNDLGSADGLELIQKHLRYMVEIMDFYISSDLPHYYHNCNVYLTR